MTKIPWQVDPTNYPSDGSLTARIGFLVNFAILAPSSSPIVGLISSQRDDRQSQLKVGRVYQRLSLLAAAYGIWCQPMSQIVQIPELKAEVSALIPESSLIPQHPFRVGYAPAEKQRTPRRKIEEVLV